jgi:AcrR family transcriptional regulator
METRLNLCRRLHFCRYRWVVSDFVHPEDRPLLRRDAERNRRRILDAARKLIAERGLHVGYDEIAREADVGVGTVYRRFPTREQLVHELFQDRVDAVVGLAEDARRVEDPWQGLCQFMEQDFELQSSDRGLREFMLGRTAGSDLKRDARSRITPIVTELVERAQAAGALRSDVGPGDLEIILAMLGGLMDASSGTEPDLWRRYLAMVLDGIHLGARRGKLPGDGLEQAQLEHILARWVPPRRSVS